ncbi:MAG: GSU2403 family nucleotidyltransferase fold protein [Rubrivivax sp.]
MRYSAKRATHGLTLDVGAVGVAARTQDIALACRHRLALAAPLSFLGTVAATRLDFSSGAGHGSAVASTSVRRPGWQGLRVDVLTPDKTLGQFVPLPELRWHAQTVPHCDCLLKEFRRVALLEGGHCVPVNAPAPERLVWHKLYSSASRGGDRVKPEKGPWQAATGAGTLVGC